MATTPDTKPETKPETKTKPFTCLTPFEHNGERIAIGGTVRLSKEQAEQHLATGSVEAQ